MPRPSHYDIVAPALDMDDQPIRLTTWHVTPGQTVIAGDPVAELCCGDAVVDVCSCVSGTLDRRLVEVDQWIQEGQPLGVLSL